MMVNVNLIQLTAIITVIIAYDDRCEEKVMDMDKIIHYIYIATIYHNKSIQHAMKSHANDITLCKYHC